MARRAGESRRLQQPVEGARAALDLELEVGAAVAQGRPGAVDDDQTVDTEIRGQRQRQGQGQGGRDRKRTRDSSERKGRRKEVRVVRGLLRVSRVRQVWSQEKGLLEESEERELPPGGRHEPSR